MKQQTSTPGAAIAPQQQGESLLEAMIARPPSQSPQRVDGIALGVLAAISAVGEPLISMQKLGLECVVARSVVPVSGSMIGRQLALSFEGGDSTKPVILGFIWEASASLAEIELVVDGQDVVCIEAERELELRCGEASIILNADGHIHLRGTYITSQASATQRILGGSVNVN